MIHCRIHCRSQRRRILSTLKPDIGFVVRLCTLTEGPSAVKVQKWAHSHFITSYSSVERLEVRTIGSSIMDPLQQDPEPGKRSDPQEQLVWVLDNDSFMETFTSYPNSTYPVPHNLFPKERFPKNNQQCGCWMGTHGNPYPVNQDLILHIPHIP